MAIQDSLTILTEEEISGLYYIPKIDPEDRERLFEITPEDQAYLNELIDSHNKIDYLLQLGYFRAVRQFYKFKFEDVQDDVWFIINNNFPTVKFPGKEASRNKYYAAQKVILNTYDFKRYDAKSAIEFDKQAKRLSKRDLSAKFIFDELLGFCEHQKTVRPKYSTLQSLVSSSISREENRLGERLGRLLSKSSRETLDKLLNSDDTISDLTLLKQDPKTFATNHMRKELDKHQKVTTLFQESKHIISELGISRQN